MTNNWWVSNSFADPSAAVVETFAFSVSTIPEAIIHPYDIDGTQAVHFRGEEKAAEAIVGSMLPDAMATPSESSSFELLDTTSSEFELVSDISSVVSGNDTDYDEMPALARADDESDDENWQGICWGAERDNSVREEGLNRLIQCKPCNGVLGGAQVLPIAFPRLLKPISYGNPYLLVSTEGLDWRGIHASLGPQPTPFHPKFGPGPWPQYKNGSHISSLATQGKSSDVVYGTQRGSLSQWCQYLPRSPGFDSPRPNRHFFPHCLSDSLAGVIPRVGRKKSIRLTAAHHASLKVEVGYTAQRVIMRLEEGTTL
ncbi:hypothetical protein B0H11DRAFT_1937463 [Mycena galericulata]|nr:hypothetical protein B0H11DRAFT_1937463 [Mycena galericulata]